MQAEFKGSYKRSAVLLLGICVRHILYRLVDRESFRAIENSDKVCAPVPGNFTFLITTSQIIQNKIVNSI